MIPRQWLVSCHRRRASAEAHHSVSDPPATPGDGGYYSGGDGVGGRRSSPMSWNDSAGNQPARPRDTSSAQSWSSAAKLHLDSRSGEPPGSRFSS